MTNSTLLHSAGSQINVHAIDMIEVPNTTPTGIWTLNHIS